VAGVQRGAQLAAHLGGWHQAFASQVAAAFRESLVFQLQHGRACALEAAHRALHVQRVAVAGVGVNDDGQLHPFSDARQHLGGFGGGGQAHV
jgi:hypothetical protein